jgi:hypothetical protein
MTKEQMQDLGILNFPDIKPKFESELQKKEYEQMLIDLHHCPNRKDFIHSKKGISIVLLYMKVRKVGPAQAMRELITDEAYTCFACP